jgi:hypothetical protein
MSERILRNAVVCLVCGEEIESTHRHDFRSCVCGAICVDGGKSYLRRVGRLDQYVDVSEVEEVTLRDVAARVYARKDVNLIPDPAVLFRGSEEGE